LRVVYQKAAGNQVQRVAEGRGISIETAILGTMNNPDFQCTIVEAGELSTGAFGVTVQQTVYVTANWTISLSDVTAMVESGFNRGKGGRVRFRSLLQDHPMFTTVDNVEVLERAFTRHPSKNPSTSPSQEPTDMPPVRQSHAPSQTPIIAPTRLVTPSLETTSTSISAVVTPKPTTRTVPLANAPNDGAPALSSLSDSDAENGVGEIDLLTAAAIAAGCIMILIASCCVLFVRYCSEQEATEKDTGNKAVRLSVCQTRTGWTSKNRENSKGPVPDMVRLDEENMSLANTSLGDQTAGRGAPSRYLLPAKRQLIEADDVPMLDSFDDSLYTSNSASPPGVPLDPANVAKLVAAKETSSSDSLSVLPQSVMPFEEDRLIFQVDYHNSDSSSESGAVQSSFLLESGDSSSILATETSRGQIGSDTAMHAKKSDDADDAFGIDLFSDNGSGAVAERKYVNNSYKAKRTLQGMKDDERNASLFLLIESGKRSPLKLDFNTEMRSGSNTSFHSLEDHNPPSAAPLTSSPTKRAENLRVFGFHSPPEEKSPGDEEEKREIDFEARDDEKANDRVDEWAHLPLDLLADHQLLERSASPSSWKVSQDHSKSKTHIRGLNISDDETKSASTTVGPEESALVEPPFDCQFLASGTVAAADFTRFIPISDGEYKESSPEAKQNHCKKDNISPQERYPSAGASGLTSTHDNGTGISGVIPRRDTDALENKSASSSSTGLSNPWFFEKLEQVMGPRSATADIESLSGRSNRSGKTHKSKNSHQSYRSHKSSRSYNATPSNQRIRAQRNIRSAAASVASYGGSSFGKKGSDKPRAPITLGHDLNRLEMQLAALQTETDQVTASSITLSSVGAKTRSTRSSKLTHTGAKLIRKRRVVVEVPPGKLGVVLANRHDGSGTVVSQVRKNSACKGRLTIGDRLGKPQSLVPLVPLFSCFADFYVMLFVQSICSCD